jgi:hypothetical protein
MVVDPGKLVSRIIRSLPRSCYLDDMQAEKVPDVVEVAAGKQPL